MTQNVRRHWYQAVAVVLMVLLAVWMFFLGRRHTVLVDNKTLEEQGIRAYDLVSVKVDDQEPIELTRRGRDQFVVTGQKHTLTMTWTDKNWNENTRSWKIVIPVGWDMALVSLPYLGNNPEAPQDEWMREFVVQSAPQSPSAEDSKIDTGDSFAM